MSEFIFNDAIELERVLLWDDIVALFHRNAEIVGIQSNLNDTLTLETSPTRFVLAETLTPDEDTIQLWAEVDHAAIIGRASLLYFNSEGQEVFSYELTPDQIVQYSPEPTPLDLDDLMDLRAEISTANWSQQESQDCAANLIFYS